MGSIHYTEKRCYPSGGENKDKKKTHKYGVEIPTSQAHDYAIYTMNKNAFWRYYINKEMLNVSIDAEVFPTGERAPPGWKKITRHIFFDAKMYFKRKA